ncbi:DUF1259 domain-containing protein [Planococcus sp. 1R117A]|uniref:DUF1259 domain-containing protein n=1 Tax=Planococcus sp. 1R117A TaxID=3447020 RepID=UPI003EDBF87C
MERLEQVAEKVGMLMKSEVELQHGGCIVNKKRTLVIHANTSFFSCTLDLDISFTNLKEDGTAHNKAEIYLLPEEFPCFSFNFKEYPIPLPTDFQQRLISNPNIVCVHLESKERPEDFAERLSAALEVIEQLDGKVYMN